MIYWMDGLRINWRWHETIYRMNLGLRIGYLYWEKGNKGGIRIFWQRGAAQTQNPRQESLWRD